MTRRIGKWKVLSSRMAFDHRWFKVRQDTVQLPHGPVLDDYFVSLGGEIVVVVPVTSDGKFILVRQYKHAAAEITLEFPAGYKEEQETAHTAARRELLEETGYKAAKLHKLGTLYHNPTKEVCSIHVFLTTDVQKTDDVELDHTEAIETILVTRSELENPITTNKIKVSSIIAAAYLAFARLDAK